MTTATAERTSPTKRKLPCPRCGSSIYRDGLYPDEYFCLAGHRFVVHTSVRASSVFDDEELKAVRAG